MSEMVVEHRGGFEFAVKSRDHELIVDLPPQLKGTDKGLTPPELFVASLASCVGMYVQMYLSGQGLPSDGFKIVAKYEDAEDKPARIGRIGLNIVLPKGLPEEHKRPLMQMAHQCKVHNSICNLPEIEMAPQTG